MELPPTEQLKTIQGPACWWDGVDDASAYRAFAVSFLVLNMGIEKAVLFFKKQTLQLNRPQTKNNHAIPCHQIRRREAGAALSRLRYGSQVRCQVLDVSCSPKRSDRSPSAMASIEAEVIG